MSSVTGVVGQREIMNREAIRNKRNEANGRLVEQERKEWKKKRERKYR
jgi:hypothetical protein